MRIVVDFGRCESNALLCGCCAGAFQVRDDDLLYVLDEHPDAELRTKAEHAARVRPKQAITVVDEDRTPGT